MKRFALVLASLLLLSVAASGQTLTVTKDGSDVVLAWTGGDGPFTVHRARRPNMAGRLTVLATDATSPYTCTGHAADGLRLEFYQVSSAPGPALAVTSPAASFTSPYPCIAVSGTHTDAAHVYVNGQEATIDGTSWAIALAPLAISADPTEDAGSKVAVTVAAVDSSGNWTSVTVLGTYSGTAATSTHACTPRAAGQ